MIDFGSAKIIDPGTNKLQMHNKPGELHVKLELLLLAQLGSCDFNPNKSFLCEKGCRLKRIQEHEPAEHQEKVHALQQQISRMQNMIDSIQQKQRASGGACQRGHERALDEESADDGNGAACSIRVHVRPLLHHDETYTIVCYCLPSGCNDELLPKHRKIAIRSFRFTSWHALLTSKQDDGNQNKWKEREGEAFICWDRIFSISFLVFSVLRPDAKMSRPVTRSWHPPPPPPSPASPPATPARPVRAERQLRGSETGSVFIGNESAESGSSGGPAPADGSGPGQQGIFVPVRGGGSGRGIPKRYVHKMDVYGADIGLPQVRVKNQGKRDMDAESPALCVSVAQTCITEAMAIWTDLKDQMDASTVAPWIAPKMQGSTYMGIVRDVKLSAYIMGEIREVNTSLLVYDRFVVQGHVLLGYLIQKKLRLHTFMYEGGPPVVMFF